MSPTPIATMFDRIAPRYDALNHLLSFQIDRRWRKTASRWAAEGTPAAVLDVATGTADLALLLARRLPNAHIVGIDCSEKMLVLAKEKVRRKQLEGHVDLQWGDVAGLPFEADSFDAVTVAFGVRNFDHLEQGLSEIQRVTRPQGLVTILEFSLPERFPVKQLYRFYFHRILPTIGRWVSRDPEAYRYLPNSVERFPQPEAFERLLAAQGLDPIRRRRLTFGIATLYQAKKRAVQ
ncbi:MAG: bifunctional demethylmenaquinone methyltransferase/2-methoxy-6-polyprenyl-1,4-benzoquinol methylase UbiE [Bacteroidales bacterium]|nr:bifunctional demethylmenaquinone methyltransferase/2-methoxy-6-polyprenyl-1,4-benzoquinol methylase UbiE [Bacteroidales bacterium]